MLLKTLIFVLGFILSTLGISYVILYSNLILLGYNFLEYVQFIISRIECWFSAIGIILEIISINISRRKI